MYDCRHTVVLFMQSVVMQVLLLLMILFITIATLHYHPASLTIVRRRLTSSQAHGRSTIPRHVSPLFPYRIPSSIYSSPGATPRICAATPSLSRIRLHNPSRLPARPAFPCFSPVFRPRCSSSPIPLYLHAEGMEPCIPHVRTSGQHLWLTAVAAVLLTLSQCSCVVFGQPIVDDGAVFYPLWSGFMSSSWQQSSAPVDDRQLVSFVWLLPQSNPEALRERFELVSDPTSPQYMQYLEADEIKQHLRPDASVVQGVLDYLTQHGVDTASSVVDQGDSLAITATVPQVQSMFATTMSWYQKASSSYAATATASSGTARRPLLRASTGLTIPATLAASTRLLLNLVNAPMPARLAAVPPKEDQGVRGRLSQLQWRAATTVTTSSSTTPLSSTSPSHRFHSMQAAPSDLAGAAPYSNLSCALYPNRKAIAAVPSDFVQARYNMTFRQAATGFDGVRVGTIGGVSEFDDLLGLPDRECYSNFDLTNIGAAYNFQQLPIQGTAPYARVNELVFLQQGLAGIENSLDSQSVYVASPTSSISLLPESDFESDFDYFTRVLNLLPSQRPHVLSLSIGYNSDSESALGAGFADATDSVIMQLGLVGVTVISASGDDGASGANTACTLPPPAELGITGTTMVPAYPTTSPYVLSVGATDFSYGLGVTLAAVLSSFTAVYDESSTTPRFCGQCSDAPGVSIACQSSYIAEQAVSVNLSTSLVNAGSVCRTRCSLAAQRSRGKEYHSCLLLSVCLCSLFVLASGSALAAASRRMPPCRHINKLLYKTTWITLVQPAMVAPYHPLPTSTDRTGHSRMVGDIYHPHRPIDQLSNATCRLLTVPCGVCACCSEHVWWFLWLYQCAGLLPSSWRHVRVRSSVRRRGESPERGQLGVDEQAAGIHQPAVV